MEDGVWRTIGGRRVFIKDGQSLSDAMKDSGKFDKEKKNETVINKKALYHQTKAESLEEFDESKRQAGLSDTSTPKGIFLKETDEDIGLEGKNQLKMEVTMEKPLTVRDREEIKRIVKMENDNYKKLLNGELDNDKYYQDKLDIVEKQTDDIYSKKYYSDDETKKQGYQKQIDKLYKEQDKIIEEWKSAEKNSGKIAQEEITKTLKQLGYDSVILEEDEGSFGRKVKSYIIFDIKQLKQIK